MKIEQILEYDISTYKKEILQKKINSRGMDWELESKGKSSSGNFASVYNSGNDPHMVNRVERKPLKANNYKLFVDFLTNSNEARNNIHFPKIYTVKTYADESGKKRSEYKIEKLHHLYDLNEHELDAILLTHFRHNGDAADVPQNVNAKTNDIFTAMQAYLTNHSYRYTPISKLKAAADLLLRAASENGIPLDKLDIGGNNIMVRRTPTGSQLVITDPFYG